MTARVVGLGLVVWLLAACSGARERGGSLGGKEVTAARSYVMTPEEAAAFQYVRAASGGVPVELNLAEANQYLHVMSTLRRAGHTAETSPQLFRAVEEARRSSTAAPPKVADGREELATQQERKAMVGTAATTDPALDLTGINFINEFTENRQTGTFATSGYSTYPPPSGDYPTMTNVLMSLVDAQDNKVLDSGQKQVFNQTNVLVPLSATPPAGHEDISSTALFAVQPQGSGVVKFYSQTVDRNSAQVSNACQQSPTYKPASEPQQCQTSTATGCVNSGSISNQLKICYGPRINTDCDYGCTGSGYPPNIIFPIVGSVNLGVVPPTPLTGALYIVLTSAAGGGCVLNATQNTQGALSQYISMNGSTASWNLAPGSFPNNNCLQPNGMIFNYTFQLYVVTATGTVGVAFTSDTTQIGSVFVPQLTIIEGCLPAGTKIRMADGSQRLIEKLAGRTGDQVRSGAGREGARAILSTTTGHEDAPMVELRDDQGHELSLTATHPVMTPWGAVQAQELKLGDRVLTEEGPARLVSVERVAHAAPVPIYNLAVGDAAAAAAQETTFFANGILVGDQEMQQHLVQLAQRPPPPPSHEEQLQRLPPQWRQDYLSSLAAAKQEQ